MQRKPFGRTSGGTETELFELTNRNGCTVVLTDFGASLVSLTVPDRKGQKGDVTLGFGTPEGYATNGCFIGGTIGRYGNRIAGAAFRLDGKDIRMTPNDGPNSLHGGKMGFHLMMWKAEPSKAGSNAGGDGIIFSRVSPDGEEGFPGTLNVTVEYRWTDDEILRIDYRAVTDKPTVVNLTHHSYFNLAGEGNRDILEHTLQIDADRFTPVNANLIPTGELKPVKGTPLDFTKPCPVGLRIGDPHEQLKLGRGYDHNFVLNAGGGALARAVRMVEPVSGRVMEVWTTEPGIQFYSGNFLDGSLTGKSGKTYGHRTGFCLEPQHFPDSPNRPEFPSTTLRPGEEYRTVTEYRFSVEKG
jgi:aldose 1-epimerase